MADSPRSNGAQASRYEPLFELASGGMGRVSIARLRGTAGFQRLVALKTIHPFLASEPRFQEMFFEEARLAAGIHHPNVVPVLDLGQLEDTYFLAMEYVPGESLSNVMIACHDSRQRIPWGVALRWIADACAGLHAAHELRDPQGRLLNVVHRDISPSNLLVTDHGSCKLTDFGIAKALATRSDTTAGALKGKVGYLSPEQVLNTKPDRRSDVFSLGIILFEVTTLRKLFGNPSHVETLEDIVRGQLPDPRAIVPDYPAPLAEVVRKALARDRTQRYQTAEEMGAAVERVARDLPTPMVQSDVTAWMRTNFGALFELRRRKIAVAIEAADKGESPVAKPVAGETVLIASRLQPAAVASPPTATIVPVLEPDDDEEDNDAEIRANTVVGLVAPGPDDEEADPTATITHTNPSRAPAAVDPSEDFDSETTVMPQSNDAPRTVGSNVLAIPPAPSPAIMASPAMIASPAVGTVPMGQIEPELSLASITVDRAPAMGTRRGVSRWAVYGTLVVATFAVTVYFFARNSNSDTPAATPPTSLAPPPATSTAPVTPVVTPNPIPPQTPPPPNVAAPQPVQVAPTPLPAIVPPPPTQRPATNTPAVRRSSPANTSRTTPSNHTSGGTVGTSPGVRSGGTFRPADP